MSKSWETKKKILDSLKHKSKTLTDLSEELNLSTSTIGQHIQELLAMNAIQSKDDVQRKWKYYEPNPSFNAKMYEEPNIFSYRLALPAIIIIGLVILAALTAYIVTPKTVPVSCAQYNGHSCYTPTINNNGTLSLGVGGLPQQASINGVACTYNNTPPTKFSALNGVSINQNGYAIVNASCASLGTPKAGATYHVWLNYTLGGNIVIAQIAQVSVGQTTSYPIQPANSSSTTTSTPTTSTILGGYASCSAGPSNVYVFPLNASNTIMCGPYAVKLTSLGSVATYTCGNYQKCPTPATTVGYNVYYRDRSVYNNITSITPYPNESYSYGYSNHTFTFGGGQYLSVSVLGSLLNTSHPYATLVVNGIYNQSSRTVTTTTTTIPSGVTTTIQPGLRYFGPAIVTLSTVNWTSDSAGIYQILLRLSNVVQVNNQTLVEYNVSYAHVLANGSYSYPIPAPVYNITAKVGATNNLTFGNGQYLRVKTVIGGTAALSIPHHAWAEFNMSAAYYLPAPPNVSTTTIITNTTTTTTIPQSQNVCNSQVTVYVGHNNTCTPFRAELLDLGQPNSNGISPADFSISSTFTNQTLNNSIQIWPGQQYNTSTTYGNQHYTLNLKVNNTFAGLYAYQKWANIIMRVSNTTITTTTTTTIPNTCTQSGVLHLPLTNLTNSLTCTPARIEFVNFTYSNSTNSSAGIFNIYNNNLLAYNSVKLYASNSPYNYTVANKTLSVYVHGVFIGLYYYQKWANVSISYH